MGDEIKLKDTVYNEEIYDSDEDSDEDESNYEFLEERDYESCDEETEDLSEILQNLLKEVAVVDAMGKKAFRVEFTYTKNLVFVDKNEDCDFDEEDGYPVMPDGGEEFFIPYMIKVMKNNKKFRGCTIETNVRNFSFVL